MWVKARTRPLLASTPAIAAAPAEVTSAEVAANIVPVTACTAAAGVNTTSVHAGVAARAP